MALRHQLSDDAALVRYETERQDGILAFSCHAQVALRHLLSDVAPLARYQQERHNGILTVFSCTVKVALRHQLSDVAALVRYSRRPQWLGIEWATGGPPALYVTPARDALAAALLDAAQVSASLHIEYRV